MGLSLWTHPYLAFKSILYGWDANSTSTVAEQLSLMEGIILTVSLLNTQTVNSEDWFKFRKEGKNEKEKLHYLTKRPRFIILQITPSETENKPPQIRLKKKNSKKSICKLSLLSQPFCCRNSSSCYCSEEIHMHFRHICCLICRMGKQTLSSMTATVTIVLICRTLPN